MPEGLWYNWNGDKMSIYESLNKSQYEAVFSNGKYIRVIAGAGSGKTRVLTMRIVRLIEELGVAPSSICAITFTNKAANEMKERLFKLLPEQSGGVHISTIHSLCVRILREDSMAEGILRNFIVIDGDDQKSILREAYKEYNIDLKEYSHKYMLNYIANNKAEHISEARAFELAGGNDKEEVKAKVYAYYVRRQKEMSALDFDDLLLVVDHLFASRSDICEKWQRRFNVICVDEFQDIDHVQYRIIKALAGGTNQLYVVGDPDQTIYTWRGADVGIIMDFEKDFKPVETIILNQNYRSSQHILNTANTLIQHNEYRMKKDLFSTDQSPEKIIHMSLSSEADEADFVARRIKELHQDGKSYRDMAILYRSNYQSRELEKALVNRQIPYIIFGGIRFYDRAEIKDTLCYLRMMTSHDDLALRRTINMPRRGIGDKTLERIFDRARSLGVTMYEVVHQEALFSGRIQQKIDQYVTMIEGWKKQQESLPLERLLQMVLDQSGIRHLYEETKDEDRLENLQSLIGDVLSFMESYPEATLDEYLQMVSLYGERSEVAKGDFIQLMTIHASKGLEFDTVFIYGLSEGVLPNENSLRDGKKGLEEERRLLYVAITRAKKQLIMSESQGMSFILGRPKIKSRFFRELENEGVDHQGIQDESTAPKGFADMNGFELKANGGLKARPAKLRANDKVVHEAYGEGIVLSLSGDIAQIAFAFPHGIKNILANHPSLKKKEVSE